MSELDQIPVINHHLVTVTLCSSKQLGQGKPLRRHLVSIVGIYKLVIVDTIRGVALDTFHGRLHLVQRNDVVDKSLSRGRQWQGLARVGLVVSRLVCLSHLKVLAW